MPDYSDHPSNIKQRRTDERREAKTLVEELRDELALTLTLTDKSRTAKRKRDLIRRANELLGDERNYKLGPLANEES